MNISNDPAALDAAAARWRRWSRVGDLDRTGKIEEEILAALEPLIERQAQRLAGDRADFAEGLKQIGRLTVPEALTAYDPDNRRGATFHSYVYGSIRFAILEHCREASGGDVREPVSHKRQRIAIEGAREVLEASGIEPTAALLAEKTGLKLETVEKVISCASVLPTVRFSTRSDDSEGGVDPEADIAFAEDWTEQVDARLQLDLYFERFTERDRAILRARFYEHMTLDEVAALLDCHRMTVWKAQKRILEVLRQHLSNEATDDIELETPALRRLLTEENLLQLPELHARVVRGFYFEARPFYQVAAELDLTVADVIEIRRRALQTLQQLASAGL